MNVMTFIWARISRRRTRRPKVNFLRQGLRKLQTDRQTDRQMPPETLPHRFPGGKNDEQKKSTKEPEPLSQSGG